MAVPLLFLWLTFINSGADALAGSANLPTSGNALWYDAPASDTSTWSTEWLPIGNGHLGGTSTLHIGRNPLMTALCLNAAMVAGDPAEDYVQLNIDTLV
jgi:hypothetical protein